MKKLKAFLGTPVGKGIITILRNTVIGAFGFIVSELIVLFTGLEMNLTMKIFVVGGLKLIDEILHKTGVAEKGITRF